MIPQRFDFALQGDGLVIKPDPNSNSDVVNRIGNEVVITNQIVLSLIDRGTVKLPILESRRITVGQRIPEGKTDEFILTKEILIFWKDANTRDRQNLQRKDICDISDLKRIRSQHNKKTNVKESR